MRITLIMIFILITSAIGIANVSANGEDISVWQGQYYKGNKFYQGTFNFKFDVNENTDGALTTSKVIASNANITIEGANLIILANKSGFSRLILKNLDSGINNATIQTVENDIGYQFSMALTSSNFNLTQQFEGENRRNLGTITLNSPNSMQFLNRWDYPFLWRIAHNGTLTPQTEIMV